MQPEHWESVGLGMAVSRSEGNVAYEEGMGGTKIFITIYIYYY